MRKAERWGLRVKSWKSGVEEDILVLRNLLREVLCFIQGWCERISKRWWIGE